MKCYKRDEEGRILLQSVRSSEWKYSQFQIPEMFKKNHIEILKE